MSHRISHWSATDTEFVGNITFSGVLAVLVVARRDVFAKSCGHFAAQPGKRN